MEKVSSARPPRPEARAVDRKWAELRVEAAAIRAEAARLISNRVAYRALYFTRRRIERAGERRRRNYRRRTIISRRAANARAGESFYGSLLQNKATESAAAAASTVERDRRLRGHGKIARRIDIRRMWVNRARQQLGETEFAFSIPILHTCVFKGSEIKTRRKEREGDRD